MPENLADVFNSLSHIPESEIDLGDGRSLIITRWRPDGDMDFIFDEQLPIKIEGTIVKKEKWEFQA